MVLPDHLVRLIEHFRGNRDSYHSGSFNEAQLRREFIDPFFEALGWDVTNSQQYSEAYKEVIHEDSLKIGANTKAPDYAFRIGGIRKFFVEAKKPAINIREGSEAAYQLRRYAWSAKLPISILTNFEELAVYDCRVKPQTSDKASTARVQYLTFNDYPEKWDELLSIFSKEAILKGSFDKFVLENRRKRGTAEVDDAFLEEIENWRQALAKNLVLRNSSLSVQEVNTAVQRTIDRIIFLRIAEDRGIEPYGRLRTIMEGHDTYRKLSTMFRQADDRYNSGLFHFRKGDGSAETLDTFTLDLRIDDDVIKKIIKSLYYPDSPYEFSVLSSDILGQVYERFLGKVIRLEGKRVVIDEKPEVKKAGGVYYTPTYIVSHIVENTLSQSLKEKTPAQVSGLDKRVREPFPLRVLDPACGSGSFLIRAYQHLLDWYREQYLKDGPEKYSKGREPKLYLASKDNWRLTIVEKRRILLTHIFGVDVDQQAVEVTKLSLLLKILEGETAGEVSREMSFFHVRALPDLASNIRCGNSLISSDFYKEVGDLFDEQNMDRINAFDWSNEFSFLEREQGFSVVLGNPPWISLTGRFRNEIYSSQERAYLIKKYAGSAQTPNMYEYFISKGLEVVRENGVFSFIVPDRFGYNDQFINLRRRIVRDFCLDEMLYRAPFPNVTVDTAIFRITARKPTVDHLSRIGEFAGEASDILQAELARDPRARFEYKGADAASTLIEQIKSDSGVSKLSEIVTTTSGVGAKSKTVTEDRINKGQIEIFKGESIYKYVIGKRFFFDFKRANISGRTTDKEKLGFSPKILLRKTGSAIIAAYDDSGVFPEQSLYFTYGEPKVDLFYLLGLLNSRLMTFVYFHSTLTNRASIAQAKKVDLDELPIRVAKENELPILIAKSARKQTEDVAAYYSEVVEHKRTLLRRRIYAAQMAIDNAVYDLYGLTDTQRVLVEKWPGVPELLR